MNIHGVLFLFMIIAIVICFIIVPWYANTVIADTELTGALQNLKVPQFKPYDLGDIPIVGGFLSAISLPIAAIDFSVDYAGYIQTVLSVGAPGFGGWLMIVWYCMIAVLASTTGYIVYTIIAGRTG